MKRRSFLSTVGTAAGVWAAQTQARESTASATTTLPRRPLGKTGITLPVVGFPGLALQHHDQEQSNAAIRKAFERGIDYFDVAPAYGKNGECEIKMGVALKELPRDKIFLACKTKQDTAEGARAELERSLERLKTDHFDLYQLHCLQRPDEVAQALGAGGALEAIVKAKEQGKIKHIGFSAHTTKAALAALNGFAFETCMFPINFVEFFQIGFGKPVLELAQQKGTSILSIKPVSRGLWPKGAQKTYQWWYQPIEDPAEMRLAMNWVLSQAGVISTLPASFLDVLDRTVDAAMVSRPITPAETEELQRLASNCLSIFDREEKAVALGLEGPAHPHRRQA